MRVIALGVQAFAREVGKQNMGDFRLVHIGPDVRWFAGRAFLGTLQALFTILRMDPPCLHSIIRACAVHKINICIHQNRRDCHTMGQSDLRVLLAPGSLTHVDIPMQDMQRIQFVTEDLITQIDPVVSPHTFYVGGQIQFRLSLLVEQIFVQNIYVPGL
jgi:hypothetical protein